MRLIDKEGVSVAKHAFIPKFVFLVMFALVGLLLAPAAIAQAQPASQKVTAIRAATLIDGVANQARHNVLIVVKGNRIEGVSEGGNPPAGATVINLPAGVTVLPR